MLLERGIEVSHGTVRRWAVKLGPLLAREVRRRMPRPGEVLQPRRDERAARRLLMEKQGCRPRRIVTVRPAFDGAAKRESAPSLEHRAH